MPDSLTSAIHQILQASSQEKVLHKTNLRILYEWRHCFLKPAGALRPVQDTTLVSLIEEADSSSMEEDNVKASLDKGSHS